MKKKQVKNNFRVLNIVLVAVIVLELILVFSAPIVNFTGEVVGKISGKSLS